MKKDEFLLKKTALLQGNMSGFLIFMIKYNL